MENPNQITRNGWFMYVYVMENPKLDMDGFHGKSQLDNQKWMVYVMENLENPNLKRMIDNWENHGLETSIYNHIYISETQIFAICGIQVMKK